MPEPRQVFVTIRRLLSRPGAVHGDHIVGRCEMAALHAARALAGSDGTVTVLTVGRARREEKALKVALRVAADNAIRVSDSGVDRLDFLGVARVLAKVVEREDRVDALICGDRSEDGLSGAVGPALAELLDLPHLSGILDLDIGDDIVATTRSQGHVHRFSVKLPAVLCVRGFSGTPAEPADASTSVQTLSFRDLELGTKDLASRTRVSGAMSALRTGTNATMVDSAEELVVRLAGDHLID